MKEIADLKGISIRQVEASIGASNGVISNAIKKGSDIQSKWASIFIDAYKEVNPIWFFTGKGERFIKDIPPPLLNDGHNDLQVLLQEKDKIIAAQAQTIEVQALLIKNLLKEEKSSSQNEQKRKAG
jgi:hypothetical protein